MSITEIIKATRAELHRIDELTPRWPEDELGQRLTLEHLAKALDELRQARSMHSFFLGVDPR